MTLPMPVSCYVWYARLLEPVSHHLESANFPSDEAKGCIAPLHCPCALLLILQRDCPNKSVSLLVDALVNTARACSAWNALNLLQPHAHCLSAMYNLVQSYTWDLLGADSKVRMRVEVNVVCILAFMMWQQCLAQAHAGSSPPS